MRYTLLLFSLLIMYSCSDMPNEVPYDSTRSVTFSVDMNDAISATIFQVGQDTLRLSLNSDIQAVMTDVDADGIYLCMISDLNFGQTYTYEYTINSIAEVLDAERSFTVQNDQNTILDYYGELNPTMLTLRVNMSYQINAGNFNIDTQTLDVAGTFNDWNGNLLELTEGYMYTVTVSDVDPGDIIEFKFRIDGNWDTSEFPGYGSNRTHEVYQGENILEYWYNDEGGN